MTTTDQAADLFILASGIDGRLSTFTADTPFATVTAVLIDAAQQITEAGLTQYMHIGQMSHSEWADMPDQGRLEYVLARTLRRILTALTSKDPSIRGVALRMLMTDRVSMSLPMVPRNLPDDVMTAGAGARALWAGPATNPPTNQDRTD
jgi:hypothetical protein